MDADFIYRFDRYEISPRLRQIRRDGRPEEAQPKTFDLLLYLIAHRDRVVDKDELLTTLWPGLVVSESALTQVVRKARALVGDDGSRQSVIRTIQRRGFRFVAPVDTVAGAKEVEPRSAEPASPEPSVAVLPFVDMSPDRSQEYFCDGMTEEITNELAGVPNLRVAARTSAFAFKNRADDVRNIGRQLGVRYVLEGSVRRHGERLRVTAQLIDAGSGFHLWSERWDRREQDMLAIQDEIAHRIAVALRRRHAARADSAAGFTAEDLCDRGFVYLHRFGRRSQRFAMDLFNQALTVDPASARACAGLALSHVVLYRSGAESHRLEALAAAERAVGLDPRSAEAWTARGAAAALGGAHQEAEAAFERALAENRSLFEAWFYYGHASIESGRYGKAAELYERAAELRPDDYQALVFAAQAYRSLGDRERERDAAQRQIAAAYGALTADPTDARALSLTAGSLIAVGRHDEARAWSLRACALEPDEPYVHYNAACAFALLGETEHALAALENGRDGHVLCRPSWVERDEDLASLRDHPRFKALLSALGHTA
ncbi:MAG: winged helix-turn-helix domain-containing protein [Gammaproteobacteria bacterium]|nr:winged helix-turn-helix domain-containing protein [Gammaproteobacteria bacterium]